MRNTTRATGGTIEPPRGAGVDIHRSKPERPKRGVRPVGAKTAKKTGASATAAPRWMELAAEFPLRPLRSDEELDRAIAMADRLIDAGRLAPEEEDYLVVLGDLIHAYEEENEPMERVEAADMLA